MKLSYYKIKFSNPSPQQL